MPGLRTGVSMELCTTCDAQRPAARAVIDWYADEDPRSRGCAQLFDAWETETMHAHGWARSPQPETAPGARPNLTLVPPGSGARADGEAPETG
ncbi:DUF6300 family protein [Streptomyces sp. NPDC102256]|uniref:DUF6300 family protein n=1 Tax=unclassified Streptomyces TaxID=2593676 RepID=UPI00332DA1A2